MTTAAEWNAKAEMVKAEIAQQKYNQANRQLSREKRRMALEDLSDKSLEVDISRAETALETSRQNLESDRLKLQGAKDGVRYLQAKNTLQQRLWATELMSLEVNLSQSEAKPTELKTVAQTLNQKLNSYIPTNVFGGGES